MFNDENYKKDFELYMELDNYDPSEQELSSHTTIFASKDEVGNNIIVFGLVFRNKGNNLSLVLSTNGSSNVEVDKNYTLIQSIKVVRIDGKFYYSFNGEELQFLGDMTNFDSTFDFPVTIGAALNFDKQPFRYFKGTLSNMYIKLGTYTG